MAAKRYAFEGFTDRELKIIELRTSGMRAGEIAKRAGVSRQAIYAVISVIYRKSGTSNTAQLTRWAWDNGLDLPAPPDTPETAAAPEPKVHKGRIRLGRIRRSKGILDAVAQGGTYRT